jgi:transposase-like protein
VLASIRRTRRRPPLPEAEQERDRRLVAEVTSGPADRLTTEEIVATIESMRPRDGR